MESFGSIVTLSLLFFAIPSDALDNGLGLTPQMGWNDWNYLGCNVNESSVLGVAETVKHWGLDRLGYVFICIDDCWMAKNRSESGSLVPDATKFPNGIANLAEKIHGMGLKLGIYSSAGTKTCAGYPATLGYEAIDAKTFTDWGIDYLKLDNCNNQGLDPRIRYARMEQALNDTGHPMFFAMCEWGQENPWEWAESIGNSWRTTGDITDSWDRMMAIVDANAPLYNYSGPGHWNDPDMLEIGNGRMTWTEYKTHFSLWCLLKAPLLLGTDLPHLASQGFEIISNSEAIAINQDSAGIQGRRVWSDKMGSYSSEYKASLRDEIRTLKRTILGLRQKASTSDDEDTQKMTLENRLYNIAFADYDDVVEPGNIEIWAAELENGDIASILLNRGDSAANITAQIDRDWGISSSTAFVRDLWAHTDLGMYNTSFSAEVDSHGVAFLRIQPM